MRNKIPEDFDWKFYLDSHPDLIKAGIKTEKLATHWLPQSNVEFRPIDFQEKLSPSVSRVHNQF